MRRVTIALACGALVLAPGCGGDDEQAKETAPATTVPQEDATTGTSTSESPSTTPAEATPPVQEPESGGSPAPSSPPAPDSPQNDTKPEPGSPAAKFEQFCDENPGACD